MNLRRMRMPKMMQNSITGIIASAVSTVSIYCIRIVISRILGDEIYGVNSIFISIVSALLILELGMSTAIIILLYRPVLENSKEEIKSILRFFRNFYRLFCTFIIIVGLITSLFFLKYFVNSNIDFRKVQCFFMLYILSVGLKYLWSYKSCLLYANKKNSVVSVITIINTVLFSALQIIVIIILKSYWIYLIMYMLQGITQNAVCNLYANRHYAFINERSVAPLSNKEKREIIGIVRPMFIQRIVNQIQDSSSVIILGGVGTSAVVVGFFSNYIFVVHACQTLFYQVSASFTTSFGNYSAKCCNSVEKYRYYCISRFYMSWGATIFSTLYLCLIQDFIFFFFGQSYLLSNGVEILLSFYVFIVLDSSVNLSTQNAIGAHYLDTKEMILQALMGIIMSSVFGMIKGPFGIAIGMIISVFVFSGIIKGVKVVKHIFLQSPILHLQMLLKETIVFITVSITSFGIYKFILKPNTIFRFIYCSIIVFILSNIVFIFVNKKSDYLKPIKALLVKS